VTISYRSLWISDLHLGTRASRASELLNFLSEVKADRIYLVGDIIDIKRMKSQPRFCDAHMRVVSEIVRLARTGTDILSIPGNHDYEFRNLTGHELLGIPIHLEAVHETAGGERLLVTHGDLLDGRIRQGTNLEKYGATAYVMLSELEVIVNRLRKRLGQEYVSISMNVIHRLKGAREYIRRFDGILYANDGDWVDHQTALGETSDGELQFLTWQNGAISAGTRYEAELLAAKRTGHRAVTHASRPASRIATHANCNRHRCVDTTGERGRHDAS
jgi:UDP-2,3-diacylglucosamine pyrophosphatase LpxH